MERNFIIHESTDTAFDMNAWLKLMCEIMWQCEEAAAREEAAA